METNTVPLYQKMMQVLIHKIEIGALKENDKLPSEQELGNQFNISRITVRKALEELQNRNFIYKKQGQGSFVLGRSKRNKYYRYFRIEEKIREMGAKPSSQILEFNIIADERYLEIKEKMGLAPVDYLYEIKKIYSGDGQKIMYRHIFIAFDRFPEIKLDELEHEEIIPLLNGKYNFVNGVFKSKAQAALVDKNDHRYLDAEIHDAEEIINIEGYDKDRLVFFEQDHVVGFLPMYLEVDVQPF